MTGVNKFNEHQYPSITFIKDDNSLNPFSKEKLYSGAWREGYNMLNKNKFTEITKEEWMLAFEKQNKLWINNLKDIL